MLYGLSTGTGDASLSVGVDGYGAFGSAVSFTSGQAGEAVYDPVGSVAAASTTFESGIAIRFGSSGAAEFSYVRHYRRFRRTDRRGGQRHVDQRYEHV